MHRSAQDWPRAWGSCDVGDFGSGTGCESGSGSGSNLAKQRDAPEIFRVAGQIP